MVKISPSGPGGPKSSAGKKASPQVVRVFPAIIIAIVCLLAAKGLQMGKEFGSARAAAEPAAKAEKQSAKDAGADADSAVAEMAALDAGVQSKPAGGADAAGAGASGGGAAAPMVGAVCPGPSVAEQAGLSASEAQVLQSLSDRRKVLEGRDAELQTREDLIAAAEKRVEQRLAEMKALQGRVEAAIGGLDAKADQDAAALVRVYEKMKPKAAAAVMETLDDEVALNVARRMKEASLAVILSSMSPPAAKHLTELMARRVEATKAKAEAAIAGASKPKAGAAKPAAQKAAPKKTADAGAAAANKPPGG